MPFYAQINQAAPSKKSQTSLVSNSPVGAQLQVGFWEQIQMRRADGTETTLSVPFGKFFWQSIFKKGSASKDLDCLRLVCREGIYSSTVEVASKQKKKGVAEEPKIKLMPVIDCKIDHFRINKQPE
mmetsp:Transcript_14907/g.25395  ORF Transcript_14907/g.25395 Transcript_14907/m.25395 type:complete len:126 (+) Transcript_14907:679-1056(+)